MRRRCLVLLLLLLHMTTVVTLSAQSMFGQDGTFKARVTASARYLFTNEKLTINDIVNREDEFLVPVLKDDYLVTGPGDVWVILPLANPADTDSLAIVANEKTNYFVECYLRTPNGSWQVERFGDVIPSETVTLRTTNPSFSINLPSKQDFKVYLHFNSPSGNHIQLNLMDPVTFFTEAEGLRSLEFFLIGLYVTIILFNAVSGLYIGEKGYLFYSLYMFSNLFFFLRQKRIMWLLLGSVGYPEWLFPFSIYLNIISGSFFVISLLTRGEYKLKVAITILNALSVISLVVVIISFFFEPYLCADILNGLSLVLLAVCLGACFRAIQLGDKTIIVILLSFLLLVAGIIVDILGSFFAWPKNFFQEYSQSLGALIQAIVVTLTLQVQSRNKRYEIELNAKRMEIKAGKELTDGLIRLNALKDEVLAQTSYELTAPLLGINSIVQEIMSKSPGMENHTRQQLGIVLASTNRLQRLIKDILDFEEIKSGTLRIQPASISLERVVSSALNTLGALARSNTCTIEKHIPENLNVFVDRDRFIQVLVSLIEYAIRNAPGSTLRFTAEQPRDLVLLNISGGKITRSINLSDLDPQARTPLFGTGIEADDLNTRYGFSISRKLMELQSGMLEIRNNPDGCMEFCLGMKQAPPELIGDIEEISEADGGDEIFSRIASINPPETNSVDVILLGTNDPDTALTVVQSLGTGDYRFLVSRSGLEIPALCDNNHIDLVILDQDFPATNGTEICKLLREKHNQNQLPILILINSSWKDEPNTYLQTGANEFVRKPLQSISIKNRAESLLSLQALTTERENLMEIGETRSTFIHFMAHNINPYLTVILNIARDLSRFQDDREQLEKHSSSIINAADAINSIVKNVLATIRLAGNRYDITKQEFALNDELEILTASIAWKARAKNQTLNFTAPEDDAWINADRLMIREAFYNLVDNAIKYSRVGGFIEVSLDLTEDRILCSISDSGPGFSSEDQEHLFQAFAKLSAQPTGNETSTGLGLFITRRLMELNGGRLHLDSTSEEGACFMAEFPRMQIS